MNSKLSPLFPVEITTSRVQTGARILLGAFLLLAGISHLTFARGDFKAQVPDWLPMDMDLVVVLSGMAEILLGSSLIFMRRHKAQVGLIAAIFFVCVFPGNISQYIGHKNAFGLDTDKARFIRLFFQPVLIAWALWSSGAWRNYFQYSRKRRARGEAL